MGLGLHGGGVATAKWLAKRGARVTATDMRSRAALAPSIAALRGTPVTFALGGHRAKDLRTHDLIVVNPGVPRESPYLAIAKKAKRRIENDASLFFARITNPVIAVTGTRGKTTTTLWIAEILAKRYKDVRPSGNTPENALLKEFDRVDGTDIPVVAELSSWQLEHLPTSGRAPAIAVITNLFADHLNRYGGRMRSYADAKANIFACQTKNDVLILNRDDPWRRYFLKKHPIGRVYFTSLSPLPQSLDGAFVKRGYCVLRRDGKEERLFSVGRFTRERGEHNLANLLAAVLAVRLFDPKLRISERDIVRLPAPRFREEVVRSSGKLLVVNDSCATSPDGTIAAIRRFGKDRRVILIAGGTDKDLEFDGLAKEIARSVRPDDLILLDGSATAKLVPELRKRGYGNIPYETLGECVRVALAQARKGTGKVALVFSPAAASFEKFLHEFDRGEKFNAEIARALPVAGRSKKRR